jgi:hypothetical protein
MNSKAAWDKILIVCEDVSMPDFFEVLGKEGYKTEFTSCNTNPRPSWSARSRRQ